MSSHGIYNYHIKIDHPDKRFPQMDSQQPPHFFGGSQVPIMLGTPHHLQSEVNYLMSNKAIGSGLYASRSNRIYRSSNK